MKPFIVLFTCVCLTLIGGQLYGQSVSGFVKDSATGEALVGAIIKTSDGKKGAATDVKGYFKIDLKEGTYTIQISYLGYVTLQKTVNIGQSNVNLSFTLKSNTVTTKEAVITGQRTSKNVTSTEMSRVELSGEQVKSLPVIFGEPDVLKAITLLPGIKSGGEGGTGFYVRGGGPDQNLILMDDAVIYNASHLLGFLSVFNTDAVRNIEVIKGGMPANYGGRLSSILSVNLREGDDQKYKINGGVGLITSRIMAEGPIKKGKSAFMVAARRTYIDALVKPFLNEEQRSNGYYFYDFNAKAHINLNEKNKLSFSEIGRAHV